MPLNFRGRHARPSSLRATKRHSGRQNLWRPLAEPPASHMLLATIPVALDIDIEFDLDTGDGDGHRSPDDASLREAILMANAREGADQIVLKAETCTHSIAGTARTSGGSECFAAAVHLEASFRESLQAWTHCLI